MHGRPADAVPMLAFALEEEAEYPVFIAVYGARFSTKKLHSMMPLVPTPARLKLLHVYMTNGTPLGLTLSYRLITPHAVETQ
jgi:hypothetical protein